MKQWIMLAGAILTEVAGSLSLKAALDQPAFYVVVAVGYGAAFVLLWLALREGMPIGVAYGIWGAFGVALTAVLSAALFGEALTPVMLVGIGLVIVGVLCVELGRHPRSKSATATAEDAG
jgi:small multidrug resistance pump